MPRLIVALDHSELSLTQSLLRQILPLRPMVKIGYEAYYAYGEALLAWLSEGGVSVMLDLKLHDIPCTVAAAIRILAHPAIEILTVHTQGGAAMLGRAVEGAQLAAQRLGTAPMKVFGVTLLTSISELELPELGLMGGIGENVVRLAALARNAGAAGVVCSPHEARELKAFFGRDFAALCPGIRPLGVPADDQRRCSTPAEAVAAGADYLVVGRPITQATDPYAATAAILREMGEVTEGR